MKTLVLGLLFTSTISLANGRQALINNMERLSGERLLESQKELILNHPDLTLPPASEVNQMFEGIKLPMGEEGLKLCYEKCTTNKDGEKTCHKVCLSD